MPQKVAARRVSSIATEIELHGGASGSVANPDYRRAARSQFLTAMPPVVILLKKFGFENFRAPRGHTMLRSDIDRFKNLRHV
jgi:hypothetical protein